MPQVREFDARYKGKTGRVTVSFDRAGYLPTSAVTLNLNGAFSDVLSLRTRLSEFVKHHSAWYSPLSRGLWWNVLTWALLSVSPLFLLLKREHWVANSLPTGMFVVCELFWALSLWMTYFGRRWLFPSAIYAFGVHKDEPSRVDKRLEWIGKTAGGILVTLITAELVKLVVSR
jgi:hypothetical protein